MDYTHPVSILKISSGYGWRKDPFTGKLSFHKGLDYKIPLNTQVYPTLPGIVSKTDSDTSYGNRIIIDHGLGIKSLYAHLNNFLVSENENVSQDTPIAYSGTSGRSTAPHLHFEIFINKKTIDPLTVLKLPPQVKPPNNILPVIFMTGIFLYLYS